MLVGWSVGPLVRWSHCEDDLSNNENMHENAVIPVKTTFPKIQNMHENAVNQHDPSNHDYDDAPDIHNEGSRKCKNVLERPVSAQYCLIGPNFA